MEIGSKVIVYTDTFSVEGKYEGMNEDYVILSVEASRYDGTVYIGVGVDKYYIPKNKIIKIVEKS